MPTTKQEFKDVASELFAEFSDFAPLRTFKRVGSYDPLTGTVSSVMESIPAIREDYRDTQFNGLSVMVGDFKLLAQASSFNTLSPRTDGVTVDVDGVECQIVSAEKDAADAVWTIQVRAL